MSLFSIFLFIIILMILVIVHELGHFLAAKALGIRVDEFAFGFPPKLWSKKIGETEYQFNLIPLGGYVKIHGEDGSSSHNHDPQSFVSKKWWQKLIVLVGGVSMNMVFAFFVLTILAFGAVTVNEEDPLFVTSKDRKVIVTESVERSPAFIAGIKEGNTILKVVSGKDEVKNLTANDIVAFVGSHQDGVSITYVNEFNVTNTVMIAPVYGIVKDKKAIGLGLALVGSVKLSFFQALSKGFSDTILMTSQIAHGFVSFFKDLVHGKSVVDQVQGPIGMAKVVGKAEQIGFSYVAFLAAILSINLAFLNILPFPALDGGRAVIVLGEALSRRKMNQKWFTSINGYGFIILMILSLVITLKDIIALY